MKNVLRIVKKSITRGLIRVRLLMQRRMYPRIDKHTLSILMDGHPYIHDDEIRLFADISRETSGPIVEIGSAFGASAAVFLLHNRLDARLYSIDPFVQDSMRAFQANEKICHANVTRILTAYGERRKSRNWKILPDYSYNIVRNWHESIDVIFIDGDHHYEAVKKDFYDWLPYVKNGGVILIHDSRKEAGSPPDTFNRGWAGPTKLAQELRQESAVVLEREAFSVTMWRKK